MVSVEDTVLWLAALADHVSWAELTTPEREAASRVMDMYSDMRSREADEQDAARLAYYIAQTTPRE